ncbi:MAG: hypothetical protein FOGNACKC_00912 [Anaerolineae bacterium]|nr:hypothetical protein [Anaerolineae bacterium]
MLNQETYRIISFLVGSGAALLAAIHLGAGAYIYLEIVTNKRNGISFYLGTYICLIGVLFMWLAGQGLAEGMFFNTYVSLSVAGMALLVIYSVIIFIIYRLIKRLLSEPTNTAPDKDKAA